MAVCFPCLTFRKKQKTVSTGFETSCKPVLFETGCKPVLFFIEQQVFHQAETGNYFTVSAYLLDRIFNF